MCKCAVTKSRAEGGWRHAAYSWGSEQLILKLLSHLSEHIRLWLGVCPHRCISVSSTWAGQHWLLWSIFVLFTGLSFAVACCIALELALGSWETLCRDKLTRSSGERVSLSVNLPPRLYLVVSSASLFLLTDHSNPQEMCSGTHFTGSLRLAVSGIMWLTFAEVQYLFVSVQRGLSWNKKRVSARKKYTPASYESTLKVTNQLRRQDSYLNVCLLFKH